MRVLLLHNRYRQPGGEERAVGDLLELLRSSGHQAELLERSSADAGEAQAAKGMLAGGLRPDQITERVRGRGIDVVHAHNLHPLLGWRALAAAREAGARTVLHLHNYRLFCAVAVAYRDGHRCFRCRRGRTLPGLRLRCRGSTAESAVYATGLHRQQDRLIQHADAVAAVSHATLRRLRELGMAVRDSAVLHNFVPSRGFAARSAAGEGEFALVAGRLVEEKGFDMAIAAARQARVPLMVAGSGPDEGRLRQLAGGAPGITFTGQLTPGELSELRRRAAMVLAPSRWEEPCPYSVLDALAAGVPVLASDRGGLPELVDREALLPAGDPAAWAAALRRLWREPAERQNRGEQALVDARERFSEERYLERLLELYRRV